MLRQQEAIADGKPNLSLADFVAPRGARGRTDYLGAFAVTAGLGADDLVRRFEREHDDYNAILVKALADRLAEAFAAYLHRRRAQGVGHRRGRSTPTRSCTKRIAASVRGSAIRRAPITARSSSCSICSTRGDVGIALTEHAAMMPAASVSGLYFAHPQARYFTVGRLGEDQIASYARRKGQSIEEVERWLTPNLATNRPAADDCPTARSGHG